MFFLYLILRLAFKVDTPTTQEPAQSTANNNIMLLSPVFGDVLVVSTGFTCVVELFPEPCVLPFPVWLLPFRQQISTYLIPTSKDYFSKDTFFSADTAPRIPSSKPSFLIVFASYSKIFPPITDCTPYIYFFAVSKLRLNFSCTFSNIV